MRRSHELKIEIRYFNLLITGAKTFEIRRNDRGFKEGDWVYLTEVDGVYPDEERRPTGRRAVYQIGHISTFEQQRGFVVFSVQGLRLIVSNWSPEKPGRS